MTWIFKYWKPLAAAALFVLLLGGVFLYGHQQYKAGYKAAEAVQAEAVRKQTEAVLQQERRAAAALAAAQVEIEKERENAKIAIDDLRGELGRVRRLADTRRRALSEASGSAGASDGQDAAAGWELFGQCAERLSGLAEVADGQRNDLAEWQTYGKVVQQY